MNTEILIKLFHKWLRVQDEYHYRFCTYYFYKDIGVSYDDIPSDFLDYENDYSCRLRDPYY